MLGVEVVRQFPLGKLGFDIAINDRDLGTKRESQLVWSGTDRDANSSRYYGVVRLASP